MDKRKARQLRMRDRAKFMDVVDSYDDELSRLVDETKRQHPMLVDIAFVTSADAGREAEWTAARGVKPDWELLKWERNTDGTYFKESADDELPDGGFTRFYRLPSGEYRAVVGMRHREMKDRRFQPLINLAVLLHERAHVIDFESKLHLNPDGVADLRAAELYAHRYACAEMARRGYRMSLQQYIGSLLKEHVQSDRTSVREAAAVFVNSSEFKRYQRIADMDSARAKRALETRVVDLSAAGEWRGIELPPDDPDAPPEPVDS